MKNKKIILAFTVLALLLATVSLNLSAQKFEKGDKDVNLTIGVVTPFWNLGGYSGISGVHMKVPLIAVSGDYGLLDNLGPGVLGVGAYFGIATYKWGSGYGYKFTEIPIAARATYHYQFVKKLDTYGGVLLGLRIERGKWYGTLYDDYGYNSSDNRVRFLGAIFVGAKYYLSSKFSVLAELNAGAALLNIGAGIKF